MILLADYVDHHNKDLQEKQSLGNPYWEKSILDEMLQFLHQPEIATRLQETLASFPETADEHWFLLGCIDTLKKLHHIEKK
jgi:hypothetical protein